MWIARFFAQTTKCCGPARGAFLNASAFHARPNGTRPAGSTARLGSRPAARACFAWRCRPSTAAAGAASAMRRSSPRRRPARGGRDLGDGAMVREEAHRAGVSGAGFSLHSDIIAPYLVRLGTEAQKQKWLPGICRGEQILAVAITEPGGGSDVKAMRTTAVRDGDEYVIDGSKTFISNGLNCDMVLLVCKTAPAAGAKGVSLIMVEADRAGFRRGRKLDKV